MKLMLFAYILAIFIAIKLLIVLIDKSYECDQYQQPNKVKRIMT